MEIKKSKPIDWESKMSSKFQKIAFCLLYQAESLIELPLDFKVKQLQAGRILVNSIVSNAKAMVMLAKNSFANEVYAISRSLFERIITFYYLQGCSEIEFKKYIDYSKQKTYRKSQRKVSINDTIIEIKRVPEINLDEYPELKRAVEEFTSKTKKKPITRWSDTSIEQKLSVIDSTKVTKIEPLMILYDYIYDDSSETMHGTIYGCQFHYGFYSSDLKTWEDEEIKKQIEERLTAIFFMISVILGDLLCYVAEKIGNDEISVDAKDTNKKIFRIIKENQTKQS